MTSGIDFDMKKEQEACLARPRMSYGPMVKLLFWAFDVAYGKTTTLGKVRLLEILARIPYQAWEFRQYHRLGFEYHESQRVKEAQDLLNWSRHAQDNEEWHLLVIDEKMAQDGIRQNWFWNVLAPRIAVFKYRLLTRIMAFFNIQAALRMNAEFEDHAEHAYFQFVLDHPELETQKVTAPTALEVAPFKNWAEVFRRIALDERDHRNECLRRIGQTDQMVPYVTAAN